MDEAMKLNVFTHMFFRSFYWHRTILDDINLCPPAEELLAPLRALLYGILLPRHKSGVTEWGQTYERDLAYNMVRAQFGK